MRGYFWYSAKMDEYLDSQARNDGHRRRVNFVKLDTGAVVPYTLMNGTMPTTAAKWDDLQYLGPGEYSHNETR